MFLGSLNENIEQCKQLVRDSMQIHPEVLRLAATINHSTTEVIEFLIIFFFYFFLKNHIYRQAKEGKLELFQIILLSGLKLTLKKEEF